MSRSVSIFLDALRFLAALVVVAGHFTQPYFSEGWTDRTLWAVSAVSVFFVLSGFVISFVTTQKEKNPIDYTAARMARLYSVLIPALVLTILVHLVGLKLDPAYIARWVDLSSARHPVARMALMNVYTLFFLNGIHGHEFSVPLDSPVWSLGFEAPYYALFGIFLFTRGLVRWALLVLSCVLFGYGILSLFPVWLSGVALHRITRRLKLSKLRAGVIVVACIATIIVLLLFLQRYLAWTTAHNSGLFGLLAHPGGRASRAPVFYYWGLITWLSILAAFAAEPLLSRILIPLEKPIRWCAKHTFSLYLFHLPLLILIYVTTHYNLASLPQQAAVFLSVLLLCVLLSAISEDQKGWWRKSVCRVLNRLFLSRRLAAVLQSE